MTGHESMFRRHLQEAFGDRHEEFTVQLTNRLRVLWMLALKTGTGEGITVADEEAFITGVERKTYAATVGTIPTGWGPSSDRDRSRPACGGCGGTGLGDYPFPCNSCGGTGNGSG
jgi:hypothetical protein